MRKQSLRVLMLALPLFISPIIVGQSQAQDTLAREGDFSLTFYFVNVMPEAWGTVPAGAVAGGPNVPGDAQTAANTVNIAWLVNNSGEGFGNLMTGTCQSNQRYVNGATVESHGSCVYTDKDGNQLYEVFDRLPGEAFTTGQWVGGSGIYQGIASTFEIRGIPGIVPADRREAGYRLSVGIKTGTYTLPAL